jgi:hypothetical protein
MTRNLAVFIYLGRVRQLIEPTPFSNGVANRPKEKPDRIDDIMRCVRGVADCYAMREALNLLHYQLS